MTGERGNRAVNVEPWPTPGLSAWMLPPWSSTSWRAMERPRPRPRACRVLDESSWVNRSKTLGKELDVDAQAAVRDDHLDVRADGLDAHPDPAVLRGELDGVREQVPEHLLETLGIAHDVAPRRILDELEAYALGVGRGGHRPDRRLHDGRDVHGPQVELELAGDDPRHVEQLVDDLVLRGGVPDDGVDGAGRLVGRELAALEQVGPADDGGQRRPQLVRQGGQELVLHPVGGLGRRARFLRLPVEVRVVHGDRRVGREAGDQALVTLVEERGIGMPEEEAAQQLVRARAHRRREVAPRGQLAGRHPA